MFNEDTLKQLDMVNLPDEQKQQILNQLNEALQTRVSSKLAVNLSDEDLEKFGKIVDEQGDEAAQKWVEANVTDYKTIVEGEAELMLNDIKALNKATQDEIAKQQ